MTCKDLLAFLLDSSMAHYFHLVLQKDDQRVLQWDLVRVYEWVPMMAQWLVMWMASRFPAEAREK